MIWIPIGLLILGIIFLALRSYYRAKASQSSEFADRYAKLFNCAQILYFLCFIASAVMFLIVLR